MPKSLFTAFDTETEYAYTDNNTITLKELKIVNTSDRVWNNVKITMSFSPEFGKPQTWLTDSLNPGEEKIFRDYVIETDTKFLRTIQQETEAEIRIILESDCLEIEEYTQKIKLPAYDEAYEKSENRPVVSRLDIWQKKLLNLSPSNPLLNCKINANNLIILCPDPAKLEDYLAGGIKISLVSAEKMFNTAISPETRVIKTSDKELYKIATDSLQKKEIAVNIPESKIQSTLVALYRKTKSVIEEGGSNTLYLAIGFLNRKKPKDKTGKIYRAPLVLCPVKLERATVQSGVKLMLYEDESRFNSTLLELLKQDYNITIPSLEGELPTDDSGLDIREIWSRVKNAVSNNPDFEVTEDVVLGHFSFNKYLMWKDLTDRTEGMKQHPIVGALIDKTAQPEDNQNFIKPEELDKLYKPGDFYIPLEADSSQLAVIANAEKGKSFVIEGPPGTGKSQTISNLIAHLMAKGKSILFVSEKMAALEVVYGRLEKAGLGKYCLELHSNKADKKEVLARLKHSWDSSFSSYRDYRTAKAEELLNIRNELYKTVSVLHTKGTNGLTPYEAATEYIKNGELANKIKLNWKNSTAHNEKEYSELKKTVHSLQIQAVRCKDLFDSEFFNSVKNTDNSADIKDKIIESLQKTVNNFKKLTTEAKEAAVFFNINTDCEKAENLDKLKKLTDVLSVSDKSCSEFLSGDDSESKIEAGEQALEYLRKFNDEYDRLNCEITGELWKQLNFRHLSKMYEDASKKFFIFRIIKENEIKSTMKNTGIKGKIILPSDIDSLAELKEITKKIKSTDSLMSFFTGWEKEYTDIEKLKSDVNNAKELTDIINSFSTSEENNTQIKECIISYISKSEKNGKNIRAKIESFTETYKAYIKSLEEYSKIADPDGFRNGFLCFSKDNISLSFYKEIEREALEKSGEIKEKCLWQKYRNKAVKNNLEPLINAIESNIISPEDIDTTFNAAYCGWYSKAVISENTLLRDFSSAQFDDKIKRFAKLDDEVKVLNTAHITAILSKGIPDSASENLTKEWKFLRHEMNKKRKIKPIRQLLTEAPAAIHKLAPCFMMSPLSVAQYLSVSEDNFDVIIFDEASQITVWDAIGSLSRGKQIIVAGDPKQMPPSNFFGRMIEYNEDELGLDEDLESILDELTGSGLPVLRLNWHYRSKCESLITFSNKKYYENTLVTFPSSHTRQKSVHYRYIENGCYERGSGINRAEAEAIVRECITRLTNPNSEIRNKSIGIVTFNSDQQKLIEDMLDKARTEYPETEFAFSQDNPEAIFVKNLETVQGDERDVILFGTTFGPDKDNKVSMNFGPLNRAGGERRLNVAFTRSKYEMIIFSSLKPEQIDLSRTKSQGVADLKEFLIYAASEYTVEKSAEEGKKNTEPYSVFINEISEYLREKGLKTVQDTGNSICKIDLAVVNPYNPDEFIAGIVSDGENYYKNATVSDRDKTCPAVLRNLGWNLIRVWSLDWWNDKTNSAHRLYEKIIKLSQKAKINQ